MIKTLKNNQFKELCKLKQKKYRDLTNTFLVETYHLVHEAIESGNIIEVFENDIHTQYTYITDEQINKLSETDSKVKIIALVNKSNGEISYAQDIVLLDDIQDPGNLGTIIRTCCAFNIKNIVISKNTCDPFNSKVIRSSQGAIFKVNIIEENILDFINEYKDKNKTKDYKILGTSLKDAENLANIEFEKKINYLILFGNEGNGVKKELLEICDQNIFIEINQMESLNVAISCGIILYKMSLKK